MFQRNLRLIRKNLSLYFLIAPVILFFIIFHYAPMYGVQIAFKDYSVTKGIFNSTFVGFKHFLRFFNSYQFSDIMKNTIGISIFQLIAGFPMPIILALMINELQSKRFQKILQTVTYAPHFLSTVVVVGMVTQLLSPRTGIINHIITASGGKPIYFMIEAAWFKPIYVLSGIWQNTGWGSIIYIAALSGVDTQLYEAAVVDGANKIQKIIYVTLPAILPTAIILLILDVGKIMNVGFEKVFLMQNPLNESASSVISTYVYSTGLAGSQFSFSAAVGLFNSVINFILIISVNKISKKINEVSLW